MTYQSEYLAFIIAWGGNNYERCGLIVVNLVDLNYRIVAHKDVQNPKELMCELASIENVLFVSDLSGNTFIYRVP